MKRLLALALPLTLAACFTGFLRADDSPAPASNGPAAGQTMAGIDFQSADTYVWYVEHWAEIAKDPDAAGVAAVIQMGELFKGKDPQQQIDYMNKLLFETKSRTIQRTIRLQLAEMYKNVGQPDRALAQYQAVIDEQ